MSHYSFNWEINIVGPTFHVKKRKHSDGYLGPVPLYAHELALRQSGTGKSPT